MINRVTDSVKTYVHSDYNPFNKDGGAYYITKQTLEDIYEDNKKKEVRRHKALGLVIGNLALFTALGTFVLFKGLPSGMYRRLRKLGLRLEDRLASGGETSGWQNFYTKALKWTRKKVEQSRSVNNFTSFKDLLFKKLMYRTKFTAKIHDGITTFFERLSRRTVNNKYRAFENSYADLGKKLDKIELKEPQKLITIDGVTKTAQEWLEQANALRTAIGPKLDAGFGKAARLSRYKTMKKLNVGLDEKVLEKSREGLSAEAKLTDNFAALKNSDVAQSFIAEDILASEKLNLSRTVGSLRNSVTQNIDDNYRAARHLLNNVLRCLEPNGTISKDTISLLKSNLVAYKKLSGPAEVTYRDGVVRGIVGCINALKSSVIKDAKLYDEKTLDSIVAGLEEIEKILTTSNKKGDFQELLTIYRNILPKKEYTKIRSEVNSVTGKLDKAISTETDEFFDKLRDLKLGAAPTDVLTILTSLGSVGFGLGLAKDRDERISASLKYGIPVVGGIATTLVMTASLVSGFKGMSAGILSSFLLSEMGDGADKFRKNTKKRIAEMNAKQQEKNAVKTTEAEQQTAASEIQKLEKTA